MIRCVVPVSGGKDSQACLKLALHQFDQSEIIGLFCDTKFEHPLTYAHIERMREMYGVDIRTVNDGDVPALVRKYKRFPSDAARFCIDVAIPDTPPQVQLAQGDSLIVMGVRGLPRLTDRHEYTADEIDKASFSFALYTVQ